MQSKAIIPCLKYRDAPAAIEWLGRAFGFEKHLVVPDESGGITHAQLHLGRAMIVMGSEREGREYDALVKAPKAGEACTQSVYVVVDEVDALFERAKQAGAQIVMEPTDQDYGGRDFTCSDPEGHVWSFGTYDPWSSES